MDERRATLSGSPYRVGELERLALTAENSWFDKLTMSAHPEPVEGCDLRD
jgi:hypothetical protein